MTPTEISHASSQALHNRANELRYETPGPHTPEQIDAIQDEIDAVEAEIMGREHDLQDPSSGLGCHQPS